jgi:hypothetical protein
VQVAVGVLYDPFPLTYCLPLTESNMQLLNATFLALLQLVLGRRSPQPVPPGDWGIQHLAGGLARS